MAVISYRVAKLEPSKRFHASQACRRCPAANRFVDEIAVSDSAWPDAQVPWPAAVVVNRGAVAEAGVCGKIFWQYTWHGLPTRRCRVAREIRHGQDARAAMAPVCQRILPRTGRLTFRRGRPILVTLAVHPQPAKVEDLNLRLLRWVLPRGFSCGLAKPLAGARHSDVHERETRA